MAYGENNNCKDVIFEKEININNENLSHYQ